MEPRRATVPILKRVNPEQAVVRADRAYNRLLVAWEHRVTLLPNLDELGNFSRVGRQVLTGCHTSTTSEAPGTTLSPSSLTCSVRGRRR
jgi:hypothetical protein